MNKLIKAVFGLAALVALTALLPASALAAKATVTHPTGVNAPVGQPIIATNVDTNGNHIVSRLTDADTNTLVACTGVELTGTLDKNTHAAVEGTITTGHFKGTPGVSTINHCDGGALGAITPTTAIATNGLPWCLRSTESMKADEFQVRGNKCSEPARPIRFFLHVGFGCTYERTTPVIGTYTTHPNHAILTISHQRFALVSGFGCPSEGFFDLTAQLFAETNGVESPLWIDKV